MGICNDWWNSNLILQSLDKAGVFAFWGLIVFLVLMYFNNLFGPPPPSVERIGYVGLAQWLLIFWGYWIDRHREVDVS